MGLLDDRVAFVTGTARGMGRNHALRLAREGASIIGVDVAPTFHPITDTPPPARPTSRKPLVWWRPRAVHA